MNACDDVCLLLCTVPDADVAETLSRDLVTARLAACVHCCPVGVSFYVWNGELQRDSELQLIIKTRTANVDALRRRLTAIHPYETPELVRIDVDAAETDYLQWLRAQSTPG